MDFFIESFLSSSLKKISYGVMDKFFLYSIWNKGDFNKELWLVTLLKSQKIKWESKHPVLTFKLF